MRRNKIVLSALFALTGLSTVPCADAADADWSLGGNFTSGADWGNAANWTTGNGTPLPPSGAGLHLSITTNITTATKTINLNGARTVGRLDIGDITTTSNSFILAAGTGGTLTFDGNGVNAQLNQISTSNGDTISAPIILNSDLDVSNAAASGRILTISGGITGANDLNVFANSAANITFSGSVNIGGVITNSGSGGGTTIISGIIGSNVTGIVQNSSTSVLQLQGAQTFNAANGILIKAGRLHLQGSAGANNPAGANVIYLGDTVSAGDAVLSWDQTGNLSNSVVVQGGANGTRTLRNYNTSGGNTFSGSISLSSSDLIIETSSLQNMNMAVSGAISGTGNLTLKVNASNANTAITLSNTSINMIGSITNAGSGTRPATISGNLGANVTGVNQNSGTSGMTLSGVNSAYNGTTTINAGTLNLASATALGGNGSATGTGGALVINGGRLNSGTANLVLTTINAQSWNGSFEFIGANNLNLGTGAVTVAATPVTLTVTANTLTVGGTIGGAAGGFTKDGAGTLVLANTNTLGATTVAGGVLQYSKTVAGNTAITVNSGATLALNVGGTGEFTATDLDTYRALGNGTTGFLAGSLLGIDTTNGANFEYASNITNVNGGADALGINKLGTNALILTGNNTYSGQTKITAGVLQIGNGGTTGNLGANTVVTSAGGHLQYSRSDSTSLAQLITGTGGVMVSGGSLTLTNAGNNFTGGIAAHGGGTFVVTSALPSGGIALGGAIINPGATSPSNLTAGNLTLSTADYTATRFNVTSTSGQNTVTIASGRTLTVSNTATATNFIIGTSNSGVNTNIEFVGGGNLVVNTPNAPVNFGLPSALLGSNTPGFSSTNTDLTGLDDVTITGSTWNVGNVTQGTNHVLQFAGGNTIVNAGTVNIGGGKGNATIRFDAANTTGMLRIRGTNGSDPATAMILGISPGLNGGTATHVMNLNEHTIDISTATLNLSNLSASNNNNVISTLSFNSGTLATSSLFMSQRTGTGSGTATSTLNVGGGTLSVGTGGIALGKTAGTGAAVTTLNIIAGTVSSDGDILDGGGNNNATLNLAGGALNMLAHAIGDVTNPIDNLTLAKGTLSNVAEINGGGVINKTTADTLIVTGTNTWTGQTNVGAGTLRVNGSITSAVSVQDTATLAGSGSTGAVTVAAGGTLAPGSSAGILSTGDLSVAGSLSIEADKAAIRTGQAAVAGTDYDQLNVTGTVDVSNADLVLAIPMGSGLEINDVLYVLRNDSSDAITGTLATLAGTPITLSEGSQFAGGSGVLFTITYAANAEASSFTGGNDLALRVEAVPEPAGLALVAIGGLGLLRRKRRSA